jgi:hypothetical protein
VLSLGNAGLFAIAGDWKRTNVCSYTSYTFFFFCGAGDQPGAPGFNL